MVSALLVRVSFAVMKHHDQGNLGVKGLFQFTFSGDNLSLKKKSRQEITQVHYLKAGAEAEAVEECCLLDHSSWLPQPAFLEDPGPPAQGWNYPQRAGLFYTYL